MSGYAVEAERHRPLGAGAGLGERRAGLAGAGERERDRRRESLLAGIVDGGSGDNEDRVAEWRRHVHV